MTNQPSSQQRQDESKSGLTSQVVRIVKKPQTQIIAGVSLIAIAIATYTGTRYIVTKVIPEKVETELAKLLKRDEVNIGEITNYSLSELEIENTQIPPTENDPSYINIDNIDVDFNLLAILTQGFLPININVENVEGYIQLDTLSVIQSDPNQPPKPLPETLKLPPLPVTANIDLNLNNVDLAVASQAEVEPLNLQSQGDLNLIYDRDNQPLSYDLVTQVEDNNGKIILDGQTLLSTTETKTQVNVTNLNASRVVDLIPQQPLNLQTGEVNANLDVEIPSLRGWQDSLINGSLSATDIVGEVDLNQLANNSETQNSQTQEVFADKEESPPKEAKTLPPQPLQANAYIRFLGKTIDIESAKANLGDLTAEVTGEVGVNQGYNLQADVEEFKIGQILPSLPISLPVNVDGWASARVNISGAIDNPQIKGNVNVENALVDKLELGKIDGNFSANLDTINLDQLEVSPLAGGKVMAMGEISTNLRDVITNKAKLDLTNSPIELNFMAELPTEELIAPYNLIPPEIKVGDLKAKGNITGKVNQPIGNVNWEIPSANTYNLGEISGKGELTATAKKVELKNTRLIANDGVINVDGDANLETKNFQGNLTTNDITLTPFLRQFCQRVNSCPDDKLDLTRPIIVREVNANIKGNLDKLSLDNIQAVADANLNINGGQVTVNSLLTDGNLSANAKANQIPIDSFLTSEVNPNNIPLTLTNSDINIQGNVAKLVSEGLDNGIPDSVNISADNQLRVGSNGVINADVNLNSEDTTINANTNRINNINSLLLLPTLQGGIEGGLPVTNINNSQLNAQVKTNQLLQFIQQPSNYNCLSQSVSDSCLNTLNLDGSFNADVGGGNINANANINNGLVKVNAITEDINAQSVIPTLPINARNINSQINMTGELGEIVNSTFDYLETKTITPPPSLNLIADTNLDVAEGNVDLQAQLNNNQWEADINTRQLNLDNLSQQLGIVNTNSVTNADTPQEIINTIANLPPLDSQIKLSGDINSLLNSNPSASVNIQQANLQLGENQIQARGDVNLVNLNSKPDISNLDLDFTADTDLDILPINTVLANLPETEGINFIPDEANLSGKADIQGKITGKNLLTNPLGNNNLLINSDVTLTNLVFNDLAFEPVLSGKVNINPSSTSTIDIKGQQDAIFAEIVPTSQALPNANIPIPYLPNEILIRQTANNNNSDDDFLVEGKRQGKQFIATVNNFNLDSLNLSPLRNYGLVGQLTGNVETEVAVNLETFQGEGNLNLTNVGIGKIKADTVNADVSYLGDVIEVKSAKLDFGEETSYDLQGKLNLATQDIEAKVDLSGDVQDIFNTLQISDISTISGLIQQIQTQDYFDNANSIEYQTLGDEKDDIETRLKILALVDKQIKELAKKISAGKIPDDLDVTGEYEGEILVAGKLTNPTASIDFTGNQWQWLPQQDFPNIVQSLGLVLEETQAIAIPKIELKADFDNGELTIQPFQMKIANSDIYFAGDLSTQKQEGEFAVKNFSLDIIRNFVPTPIDVEGNININGKLAGNYLNPQIEGNLEIDNVALEGVILEEAITADYNYKDYQLNLQTILPEEIQLTANLPYHPIVKTDKPANINLNLDTKAIALLDALTQGQIQITGGEANANLTVETASIQGLIDNLDFKQFELNDLLEQVKIQGEVNLNEAEIGSIALSEPIYLTGKAELLGNAQAIKVENIKAKVRESEINIAGILPLIKPLTNNPAPLTVSIPEQQLELENLYSGNVDGDIKILGTALKPEIGGYLALNRGNVKVLSRQTVKTVKYSDLWYKWLGEVSKKTAGIFQPEIENFEVKLGNLQLAQWGLYRFIFDGNLNVNGPALDLQQLKADGTVNLNRGAIYLGGVNPIGALASTSETTFNLSRKNDNRIVFNGNESILNPQVNILVEADITDYSRELPSTQRNEIPEQIVRSGQGESVRVTLGVDGGLQQLLPALAGNLENVCNLRSEQAISDNDNITQSQLDRVARCVNIAALNSEGSSLGLLNSPLVELSSVPTRSEGELINLLIGGQLLNLANQLQDLSGEQLFETGFVQFILMPIANDLGFGVNETVSSWGQPLGMDDLRVFPLVEGVYKLQEKSNLSVSYDYIYSEFKVRYQMRF